MTPDPKPQNQPKQQALGRKVSKGVSVMVLSTFIIKTLSFISTFVLGLLLDKADYAVYGIAMGIATFAQVLRDGGMRQILIQKQAHRYAKLSGPVFWLSGAFNGTAGILLGLAAYPLAALYKEPELGPVLLATAASIFFSTSLGIYRAKMAVDLNYRRLAEARTLSSAVRYTSMILFALLGFGPLAFTLPLVICVIAEGAFGFYVTREKPWTRPPRFRLWPALWSKSKWLIFGTFAMSTLRQGDYLVLGWLKVLGVVSISAVGFYVFAYQIAVQINVLVIGNLHAVLFPALSKLHNEPERHKRAVLRAIRVMMLFGSGFGLILACTFEPLQVILWGDKWAPATEAVVWMAVFFPLRLLTGVLNSAQLSKGRFREWFWLTLVQGAGMMLAAAVAGVAANPLIGSITAMGIESLLGLRLTLPILPDNSSGIISLVIGIYFAVGVAPTVLWGFKRMGIRLRDTARAVLPTWLVACAAAAATLIVIQWIPLPVNAHPRVIAAVDYALRFTLFGIFYLAALRAVQPKALAETIDVAPKRYSNRAARLLRLKKPEPLKPAA